MIMLPPQLKARILATAHAQPAPTRAHWLARWGAALLGALCVFCALALSHGLDLLREPPRYRFALVLCVAGFGLVLARAVESLALTPLGLPAERLRSLYRAISTSTPGYLSLVSGPPHD